MLDDDKYYRKDWMTDSQWECALMLRDLESGFHHLETDRIKPATGAGISYNFPYANFATFDYDELTRLVFMAHKRCIRAQISGSGPNMLCLHLHKRLGRDGNMTARHPTIEQALEAWSRTIESKVEA